MGYLILAIICSSMIAIVMRIGEKYVRGDYGMLAFNYMACTIVAASYSGVKNLLPKTAGINFTLGLGICTGILYLPAVILINAEKTITVAHFKAGLVLLLVISGICDGMSKIQEEMGKISLSDHFLFYTFGTALLISIILLLKNREKAGMEGTVLWAYTRSSQSLC